MNFYKTDYKIYDQIENADGTWTFVCPGDDVMVKVVVDANDQIVSETNTNECACRNCQESK